MLGGDVGPAERLGRLLDCLGKLRNPSFGPLPHSVSGSGAEGPSEDSLLQSLLGNASRITDGKHCGGEVLGQPSVGVLDGLGFLVEAGLCLEDDPEAVHVGDDIEPLAPGLLFKISLKALLSEEQGQSPVGEVFFTLYSKLSLSDPCLAY